MFLFFLQGWENASTRFHTSHFNVSIFHVQINRILVRIQYSPLKLVGYAWPFPFLILLLAIVCSLSPAINALQCRLRENEIRV